MNTASLLIDGIYLVKAEITSKVILGTLILVWIVVTVSIKMRKPGRMKGLLAVLIAIIVTTTIIGGILYMFRPGISYGIEVAGSEIIVRFYADETVTYNLCRANITLIPADKVDDILSIRMNGIADPATGLYAGYFKTVNGLKAYVLVYKQDADKAIIVSDGETMAIIGLNGASDFYNEINLARENTCPE